MSPVSSIVPLTYCFMTEEIRGTCVGDIQILSSVWCGCSMYTYFGLPFPSLELSRLIFALPPLIIGAQEVYCHACMYGYVCTATFEQMNTISWGGRKKRVDG